MTHQTTGEQQADDRVAIRAAALDYLQGWYEGNAERMQRSLHQGLAKHAILRDPQTGGQRFHRLSQQQMVEKTQQGGGTDTPPDKRYYDITILDVYEGIACVKAESYEYVEYLSLARSDGTWVIANVLWTDNRTKR